MDATSPPPRGRIEQRVWRPTLDYGAPRRHRVAQTIDCFVPDPIADWDPTLTASTAALIAEADGEVRELDRQAPGVQGLDALARQLLRQESVGSSRIENLIVGQLRLARAAPVTPATTTRPASWSATCARWSGRSRWRPSRAR